jgi:DNA-binding transcriptional regulator YdaS (Cro superfamily)
MDIIDILRKHIRSQSHLARQLGITPQALDGWRKRKQIPAERVLEIERITKHKVTRYMLRPDIFGTAPEPNGSSADCSLEKVFPADELSAEAKTAA